MSKKIELIQESDFLNTGRQKLNDAILTFNEAVFNGQVNVEGISGTAETLGELQERYPNGDAGVYVVTSSGHWYYWKDGAWNDGGVYQAKEVGRNSIMHGNISNSLVHDVLLSDDQIIPIPYPSSADGTEFINELKTWAIGSVLEKSVHIKKIAINARKENASFSISAVEISGNTAKINDSKIYSVPNKGINTIDVDFYVAAGQMIGFSGESYYSYTNGSDNVFQIDRNGLSSETGVFSYEKKSMKISFSVEFNGLIIEPVKTLKSSVNTLANDVYVERDVDQMFFPSSDEGTTPFWSERKFMYDKSFDKDCVIKKIKAKGFKNNGIATISLVEKISDSVFYIKEVYPFVTSLNEIEIETNINIKRGNYIAVGGNLMYVSKPGGLGTYQIETNGDALNTGVFNASKPNQSTVFTNISFEIKELIKPADQYQMIKSIEEKQVGSEEIRYITKLPREIICIGDSITYGLKSSDPETKSYPAILAKKTGIQVVKNAVSGSQWTAHGSQWDIENAIETRVMNIDFSEFDAVVILAGTNDWQYNATLEELEEAIENVFSKIYSDNKSISIIVLTPLWRNHNYKGDSDYNANDIGLYLRDICDTIIQMCKKYKIKYDDAYFNSGIGLLNYEYYYDDGLHPNDTGYEYLASYVSKLLLQNFNK